MKVPRDLRTTPKGGWTFKEPSTGREFHAAHPKALVSSVFQYRFDNPELGLDFGSSWTVRFWNEWCNQHPHIPFDEVDKPRWFPSLSEVWDFVRTLVKWKTNGGLFVDQAEAERRAKICLEGANGHPCPYNEPSGLCLGCKNISGEVHKLLDGRKTSLDDKLHFCHACGSCQLVSKVWFPLDVIHVQPENLPPWCWQKR